MNTHPPDTLSPTAQADFLRSAGARLTDGSMGTGAPDWQRALAPRAVAQAAGLDVDQAVACYPNASAVVQALGADMAQGLSANLLVLIASPTPTRIWGACCDILLTGLLAEGAIALARLAVAQPDLRTKVLPRAPLLAVLEQLATRHLSAAPTDGVTPRVLAEWVWSLCMADTQIRRVTGDLPTPPAAMIAARSGAVQAALDRMLPPNGRANAIPLTQRQGAPYMMMSHVTGHPHAKSLPPDPTMTPELTMQDHIRPNLDHWQERVDMAAAFRWTVRLDMHEAVANHFSLSVNDDGTKFLMNPNQKHFARVKASDLLLVDANDPTTMDGPDAPDPTAWGLHGGLHKHCAHARCAMHVHSKYATVLACLADPRLPPIDQTCAMFFDRYAIDADYGGLAFEDEGARCANLLDDPRKKVLIMGNHGIMVIGDTVAETFNRLFYFERAAQTYILALQTGVPLKVLPDDVAEKTAQEIETYPEQDLRHLAEIKAILDAEGSDYAQ